MRNHVCAFFSVCVLAATSLADIPMIISHRGESSDAPENTMAAFQLAVDRGVAAMECDVYVTSDGVPVIMHDQSMARTTGVSTNITDCTAAFVTNTVATAFSRWASSAYASEKVPTLEQYLALLSTSDVTAVIELKAGNPDAATFISAVAAAVQAQSAATSSRVIFISFSSDYISRIRAALPDYPAYYLVGTCPSSSATLISTLSACNATGVDAHAGFDAEYVAAVKSAGYAFATWTVDDASTAAAQWRMGVDAITTNKGKLLTEYLSDIDDLLSTIGEKMYFASVTNGLYYMDVRSYVQDGLVAHFDGIRNAGADADHDSSATTWKNLGSNGIDASFVKASDSTADWTDDGYYFHHAYALVDTAFALGGNFTIQWVGNVDTSAQTTDYPNYFAAKDDWCIFTRTTGNTIEWKTVSPQLSSSRSYIYNWEGRCFSAIVTNDYTYITQAGSYANSKARTNTSATGAKQWSFGGSANGPAQRYTLGVTHAVRIYDHPLSEAELARNMIVDVARYRNILPVTNVVVASEIPELVGAESNGCYAVSDVHAFTAPASISLNGNTYTNAGYSLEMWNCASNIWRSPTFHAGRTYTYTTGVSHVKVRLTWLWSMSEGVRRYNADEYARNGLVLHLDGVRNAGIDQPHSETTTNWINLADPDNSATITEVEGTTNYWAGTGFFFGDGAYAQVASGIDPGLQFVIQTAVDFNTYETHRYTDSTVHFPTFFAAPDDNCGFYGTPSNVKTLFWKTDKIDGSNYISGRSNIYDWNCKYVTAVMDYATHIITDEVIPSSYLVGTFGTPAGSQRWCVGSSTRGLDIRYLTGTIFSVRLYNRILTERELTLNREIDDIRFRGAMPSNDTVVVDSSHRTLGGDDEKGLYTMVGGIARTFSVSNTTAVIGDKTLSLSGYTLETWDSSKLAWGDPVSHEGDSYTYAAGTDRANVRLTWQWKVVRGIKTAYDVDDYVRGGLIAMYDGVRNAGADADHDSSAPMWTDLSGNGRHANFRSYLKDADHSIPYEGVWSDDGRVFSGDSFATMSHSVNVGRRYTLQGALDIDSSVQTTAWPTMIGNPTDNGNIYTYDTRGGLYLRTDETTSTRANLGGWQGRSFTGVVDYDRVNLTQTDTLNAWRVGTFAAEVGNKRWMIGGIADTMATPRYLIGTVHAIRMYNRVLSQEELKRNFAVDANRYRGEGLAVTNVVVSSARDGAQGVESNGVYEVEGEWTFTAMPFEDTDGHMVVPTGYSLETWTDGAWVAAQGGSTTNFTYTVTDESVPVRLTWKWQKISGTLIFMR